MESTAKIKFSTDPRILAEYAEAKSLLHEKKAIQKRLREIDKHLRDLRTVAVAATECALHDLAYESNISPLLLREKFAALHK
jgi:hypothetical protein